jgi:hypothetical protein
MKMTTNSYNHQQAKQSLSVNPRPTEKMKLPQWAADLAIVSVKANDKDENMKTRFAIALAVIAIVSFGAAAPTALAATFSDDFSSGLRPTFWTVTQTTPGLFSVDDTHGDVRLAKVGNSPGGLQAVEVVLNLAAVGGPISGDFSTQIDFRNAVVGPNNDQIPLNVNGSDFPFDETYDSLSCGHLNVHVWNGGVQGCVAVTGNSGTFTISRTGGTLTGYYNGSPIFSESNSSVVTHISFALQVQPGSNDNTSVTFDNFSLTAASVPSACTPPPPQMVSWWPGDGNANDIQDGNNGTLQGGATFASGLVGQAFSLNGVDSYIDIPHNDNLNPTGPFSVDAWVNANPSQSYPQVLIIDKSHGFTDSAGWAIQTNPDGTACFFYGLGGGCCTNFIGPCTQASILDGQWHHLAGVWTGTVIQIYEDAVLQNTVNSTALPVNNNRDVHFGMAWGGGTPTRFFHGLVDEVEIFNRALSAGEIQAIVDAGSFGKCRPTITSAVSRKTHGAAGTFDVEMPLTGSSGVECRTGGATHDYNLVVTFSGDVTVTGSPQSQVTTGTGCVGTSGACDPNGTVSVSGNIITVPLTNIADAQVINVQINGINSVADTPTVNLTIPMGILIGDTNANRAVNAADVAQTKSRLGLTVDGTNFRSDVNVNGTINAADVAIVKQNSGTSLPPN